MTQGLGKRDVRYPMLCQCSCLRVCFADGIADHDKVRLRREVLSAITGFYLNSAGSQKIAHGRVDIFIRPGNQISGILEHAGKRAHAGTADTHKVNVVDLVRKTIEGRE